MMDWGGMEDDGLGRNGTGRDARRFVSNKPSRQEVGGRNSACDESARVALVVEDDYVLASDLASKLSDAGMKIVGPLPNVQRALDYHDTAQIDVAVLDINLGGTMVFCRCADQAHPFFFATGYSGMSFLLVLPIGSSSKSRWK